MERRYAENCRHYDSGLERIGCSENQAKIYSTYFRDQIRGVYFAKVMCAVEHIAKNHGGKLQILDVGCGLGDDIELLGSRLKNVAFIGTEISHSAIKICKNKLLDHATFFHGRLEDLNLEKAGFDLVINFCVLEHVASPFTMLRSCSSLLKDDGLIVIAVPNHLYWASWNWPIHLWRFVLRKETKTHSVRRNLMSEAIQDSGLHVIEFDTQGFRPPQRYFCYLPESILVKFVHTFPSVGELMCKLGMKRLLYLNLYMLAKAEIDLPICKKGDDLSASWFISATIMGVSYFSWWIVDSMSRIKKLVTVQSRASGD